MEGLIEIQSFGLIGQSKTDEPYRHLVFKDTRSGLVADFVLFKKQRPQLWADVEKMETGASSLKYMGYVARFNNLEIVVFGNESLEDAFERQKWRLKVKKKINLIEADNLRELSSGFVSNLTREGCMEISWGRFDQGVKMVKFRKYLGKGQFEWGKWIEIG